MDVDSIFDCLGNNLWVPHGLSSLLFCSYKRLGVKQLHK